MLRNTFARQALLTAKVIKGKEEEGAKYRDYFDCSEPLKRCSSHRLLAIRRAEAEGLLKVSISPNDEECVERLERQFVQSNNACGKQVAEAVQDAYKRLLKPSIETEFAAQSKERADDEAIRVFAENLRQLLLASPLGQKRVMGIDPGFRHRLQGGVPGCAGQPAAQREYLSASAGEPKQRGVCQTAEDDRGL